MKNSFNLKVSFSKSPVQPYEWTDTTDLFHQKVEKVSSELLREILMYEGKIVGREGTMLLSDSKNAVALRLSKDGTIKSRSFLEYDKSLDICEYTYSLKKTDLEFVPNGEKVEYSHNLVIENEMREYIIHSIKKSANEDLEKYLYYLCEGDIKGYSKDKLLKYVENASLSQNMKLYELLIEN